MNNASYEGQQEYMYFLRAARSLRNYGFYMYLNFSSLCWQASGIQNIGIINQILGIQNISKIKMQE